MYLPWKPEGTLRVSIPCFWLSDNNKQKESTDMKEKLFGENQKSISQQTYVVSKLYLSRTVYLGKRLCSKVCVCVCVCERERESGGELFEVIAQYFSLTIKHKQYTTPQCVLKMFGTSRIFCCPLEKWSLLGRCWDRAVFYKDSLLIHPREAREF